MNTFSVGCTVTSRNGYTYFVDEIGMCCDLRGGYIVPVKLDRGRGYDIAYVYEEFGDRTAAVLWTPNTPEAAAAIRNSLEMPSVEAAIDSNVHHHVLLIHGQDKTGPYLVKKFYNPGGRYPDELHR